MSRRVGTLPLAFVLAMAADTIGGAGFEPANPLKPLELGTLSGLLKAAIDNPANSSSIDKKLIQGNDGTKLVQFFPNFPNFRNCMTGAWRNC